MSMKKQEAQQPSYFTPPEKKYICCVVYESEEGRSRTMQSKLMTWKRAENESRRYRALGHKSWVEKVGTKAIEEVKP